MDLNVVVVSSPSSQMGFIIAYRYFFECISPCLNSPQFTLIIVKPRKNSLNSSPGFINELKFLNKCRAGDIVWILVNQNLFYALVVYILIWFVSFLSPFFNIRLWQPRHRWLNDLFSFKNSPLSLPVPSFKQVLFGDGFLQDMKSSSPFWLQNQTNSSRYSHINPHNLIASIYHFSLLADFQPFDYKLKSFCVPKEIVLSGMHDFYRFNDYPLDSLAIKQLLVHPRLQEFNKLSIFPTTSFSETRRCCLSEEIDLYRRYINSHFSDSLVVIKPHPISSASKLNHLSVLASAIDGVLLGGPSWDAPLELLIYQLIHQMPSIKINLVIASTAGISCARLFEKLSYKIAFGYDLLND